MLNIETSLPKSQSANSLVSAMLKRLSSSFILSCGLLLGSLIVLPIGSVGFSLPKWLVLSLTVLLGSLCLLIKQPKKVGSVCGSTVGYWWLAFIGTTVVSLLWSTAPIISLLGHPPRFEGILTMMLMFSLCWVVFATLQTENSTNVLVQTIVTCGTLVSLYAILQALELDPFAEVWSTELFLGRTFSFLGQPNALAQYILLCIPFTLLIGSYTTHSHRMYTIVCLCIMTIALLTTASRTGVIGLVCIGLITVATSKIQSIRSVLPVYIGPLLLGVFGVAMLAGHVFQDRFAQPGEIGRSLGSRGVIAATIVEMIQKRPPGYGLESLTVESPTFTSATLYKYESLNTEIDRAHSKPLDLLVTLGPLGLIAYYGFLLTLLFALWKQRNNTLARSCFLALASISIVLLLDFDTLPIKAMKWVIIGLALHTVLPPVTSDNNKRSASIALSLCIVASCICTLVSGFWLHARYQMQQAENTFRTSSLEEAAKQYSAISHLYPYDRTILINTAETYILLLENNNSNDQYKNNAQSAISALCTLTANRDGSVAMLQGWLTAVTGNQEEAETHFAKALEQKPISIPLHRIIMHSYELLGNTKEVERTKQQIISLLPAGWNDASTNRGRILQKENPWLKDIANQP